MKKSNKLNPLVVGKGATGKLPSYMKKFVPEDYIKDNTVNVSAAEEVLFEEKRKKKNNRLGHGR